MHQKQKYRFYSLRHFLLNCLFYFAVKKKQYLHYDAINRMMKMSINLQKKIQVKVKNRNRKKISLRLKMNRMKKECLKVNFVDYLLQCDEDVFSIIKFYLVIMITNIIIIRDLSGILLLTFLNKIFLLNYL